jgi:hypothetical protein
VGAVFDLLIARRGPCEEPSALLYRVHRRM